MFYEIRQYHFAPDRLEAYRKLAASVALPVLRRKMDVVGFWIVNDMEPEYGGATAPDDSLGTANVVWIIRWNDQEQRDRVWQEVRADPDFQSFRAQIPGGPGSYLRTEAKFATDIA